MTEEEKYEFKFLWLLKKYHNSIGIPLSEENPDLIQFNSLIRKMGIKYPDKLTLDDINNFEIDKK